jgi:hypothetical protein
MAHQRSPNCPQISFSEAIEKGRKVYEKEHTHPAAKLVIAADLGYSSINGRSLSMVGALRQYGVLEGSGEAMRVSDDAVAYYELEDGTEKRAAIERMAFKPALFSEMRQQFGTTTPSEANLKHWLIKKEFLPKAATDLIRVYKANLDLVTGEESGYSDVVETKSEVATMSSIANTLPPKTIPGVQTYAFALSPDARAELSLKGTITAEDLDLLRDHIELTIKALARTAKRETS